MTAAVGPCGGEGVRVAHLTSVHPVHDTRILYRECAALSAAGYDVTLVAPHDRDETVAGIRVKAVRRPKGRPDRLLHTTRDVYRAAVAEHASVYHLHDPELLPVGVALRRTGAAVVYDAHEDAPLQVLGKHWIPAPLRPLAAACVRATASATYGSVDAFVAATPSIAAGLPPDRTVVVQNFPVVEELATPDAPALADREHLGVYVGGLSGGRGIREMVVAAGLVSEGLDFRLLLAGRWGRAGLESEIARVPGADRVEFLGWQSRSAIRRLLARVRLGLVPLHPARNYLESYPIKLFEYMAAGLPVVASDFPLWRRIVEGAGCGLLIDPLDPSSIASAVTRLLDHPEEASAMGDRGRRAVMARYRWDVEAEKLIALYARLAQR